jgi:hydroxymethylglutaryl-CoA reductase
MIEAKVTLAMLAAVAVQAGGLLLWTGSAAERLKAAEVRIGEQADVGERLARLEAYMQRASEQLERIERRMERREASPAEN